MKVLFLSESQVVAYFTAKQLEIKKEDINIKYSCSELFAEKRLEEYDILVICRALEDNYGDPLQLMNFIIKNMPECIVIVTFALKSRVINYEKAGFLHFYVGQPLIDFNKYVNAVVEGQIVPMYATTFNHEIVELKTDSY